MAIFNSYVKLPEGIYIYNTWYSFTIIMEMIYVHILVYNLKMTPSSYIVE